MKIQVGRCEQRNRNVSGKSFLPSRTGDGRLFRLRIRHDVDKLSRTAPQAIKAEFQINGRDILPHRGTLHVDNLAFPSLYLDISLDTGAKSIHVHQLRRESMEGRATETDERLLLDLDPNDDLIIKDADGKVLQIEDVSKFVLRRFLYR